METENYKVYIKTNADGIVTAINSSAFVTDSTGWIEIDSGNCDKYHHAQGNYLSKCIMNEKGLYNYKYVDGKIVERTTEDKQPELTRMANLSEIADLKRKLSDTDYISIKIAEGEATKEDYETELMERKTWRLRINELQS